MNISFQPLHPLFAAEVDGVDLRNVRSTEDLDRIRSGMDRYAVLVFRSQPLGDDDQLDFAQRFDGTLHSKTGISALQKSRFGNEALTDISNVSEEGAIMAQEDRRRAYSLANRLWHADATFQDPPGRYSMLHARVVPPMGANTEFADERAAYDDLSDDIKTLIADLRAHHSIAYSRQTLGFEFSEDEKEKLKGAIHPLVRMLPRSDRRSLYLASHAFRIVDWPVPDGRLLLRDLMEHATQRRYVYSHRWRVGDLVVWDNRCTLHRATPFEDTRYKRELRRVTTLDIEAAANAVAA